MARYLGIEVSEGQVKGVVLRTAYRKLQIESVTRVPRAPGPDGLAAAVSQLRASVIGSVDASYAALPGTEASLRLLELPKAVAKRGGRFIATELEGALPFDIEAAVIDAQVVTPGEQVQMLAAAARTERVGAFVDALKAGGVDPREVGVGPIALGELASAIPELAVPGPVLLVYAYETHADLCILASGVVQMARTLGGQTTPAARLRGIKQTVAAFVAGGGAQPTLAVLCGDSAAYYMVEVADAVGLTNDQVKFGFPPGGFELSPAVGPGEPQLAPLALAVALRGLAHGPRIDLRKGSLSATGGSDFLRERWPVLAGALAAVVLSWGFATWTRYAAVAEERDRLRTALGRVTEEVFQQRVTTPARAKALALGTSGQEEQDPLPLADAYDVIGVLSTRIPDSIRHDITQLDVSDEHVQLQGVVDSLADRDRIVEALGQYECFQNIRPGRAQRNPGDNRQQYTLDIDLRCPERAQAAGRPGAGGGQNSNRSGGASGGGV